MARQPFDEYLRKMGPLNVLFAASSIGLLLVTVGMVYDDYARGWKRTQRAFRRIEAAKLRAEIEAAEKSVDREALQKAEASLKEAQAALEARTAERAEAEARLKAVEVAVYKDDLAFRTVKSTYDARRFDYEEALHRGSAAAARLETEMRALDERLQRLQARLKELEKERAGGQAALAAITSSADEARAAAAGLQADVVRLEKSLARVAPGGILGLATRLLDAPLMDFMAPTLKIQQVVLERVPMDINFTRIPRADRCQTCHLGIDRDGFEEQENPFRTHPRPELFVGGSSPHPADRFGCTPCHGGRDRAVDFVYATHTPDGEEQRQAWEHAYGWERDHYWDTPMLAKSRIEAGCLKCHAGVVAVPQAARLNRGLQLVDRIGCYACHKMRGFENRPKVAPPLVRITSKTTTDWMGRWIKNPKVFRPSTRMPRVFGLENHRGPGDAEREDAEVIGIVAYLETRAEKVSWPALPGRGDVRRGERLVKTVGCMGCHAIERDEVAPDVLAARDRREAADPIAFERRFGPDLSRVGSKVRPEWLFQWVRNPHAYNPASRMPSLRLTAEEALDVTAYLMSLKDDTPEAARVAAPRPQPEARDRALMVYLTERMPPADAAAKLAAMSDAEKDVLLGERTISRSGCFGCHLIPGFEKTPPIGVELSEEGSKHPDLLYFGYVEIEHTAPAWFFQKLKEPRSFDRGKELIFKDRLRMPQFGFTDDEAEAITLVLQGLTKEKVPLESVRLLSARDEAVEAGRRVMRDYNCKGCHIDAGEGGAIRQSLIRNLIAEGRSEEDAQTVVSAFAPPILDGEGDKVQPDWLFAFLRNPSPIRPWLAVRMPTFGFSDQEGSALAHHFAARDNRTFPFETHDVRPPRAADLRAALAMFGEDYFNCWSCHQQGARKPQGPPEGWAPDLMLAHERLNPDWIARWIENPQKLMPGTKMPTYYDPEDPKGSAPPDILGGDPQVQIRTLRDYVFTLGMRRAGGAAGAQP